MTQEAGKETTEPDNINVGLVATVTIVGALLTVSTAAALTALVRSESGSHETAVGAHANLGSVERLKAEQRAKLEAPPSWAKRETGHVSVPIDRAMQLVVSDIQKNPYLATLSPPTPKEQPDAGADGAAATAPSAEPPAPAPTPAAPVPAPTAAAPVPAPTAAVPVPGPTAAAERGGAPAGGAPRAAAPAAPPRPAPAATATAPAAPPTGGPSPEK